MSARRAEAENSIIRHWLAETGQSAATFERRWTWLALKRVNPELSRLFQEQRDLFDKAVITGDASEVEMHGAATCRGYAAIVKAMEAAAEPDNAYLIGQDPKTGFRIAIGHQKAAAERVVELHGKSVVWTTPDELAAIMAGLESFKALASMKRLFPGAELLDLHPSEPAKFDSGLEPAEEDDAA